MGREDMIQGGAGGSKEKGGQGTWRSGGRELEQGGQGKGRTWVHGESLSKGGAGRTGGREKNVVREEQRGNGVEWSSEDM